ncbi:MAG: NUDIX hydrolase [Alphaproteobacteria bacterium]|nr:NUDIX hydrolase [Alphaproteobacteria bacterium]
MEKITKKKIYKNIYELNINLGKSKSIKDIKENYIFNGRSVSAICFNRELKIFYFIRQFRPNYFFNKFKVNPLEIVAGGVKKNESSRHAILREIKEELGVKAVSLKKIDSLIIAPDCLEEITEIYFAEVPIIKNFEINNPKEGEYIKIISLKKNEALELINKNNTQNLVTKYALLKIKEIKI